MKQQKVFVKTLNVQIIVHLPTSTPSFPLLCFPWVFLLNQYNIYKTKTDFTDARTSCCFCSLAREQQLCAVFAG